MLQQVELGGQRQKRKRGQAEPTQLSGCPWDGAGGPQESWLCPTPSARLASDFSPTEAGRVPPWKRARHAGDLFPSAHFTAEL